MARVHKYLIERHGQAILLGADTPQLQASALQRAHDWLNSETPRQVLGPAEDGGFWLYGANRVVQEDVWTRVPYSHSKTLCQFKHHFDEVGEWEILTTHTDVDEQPDLEKVHQALVRLSAPTAKQSALLRWMSDHTTDLGI
jgi:glycosyltransferase A (GT-A) superfamily protein (DUF2064 family)